MNLQENNSPLFGALHKPTKRSKVLSILKTMRPTEKIVFGIFAIVAVISFVILLYRVNKSFLVEIPALGGKFTEGLIGNPRFINPILAISDTDKDLSYLLYSGLVRQKTDGSFVNDLAESYNISEDGLQYYFKIKENVFFHDGRPIESDDVIFTIEKALDPVVKSPKRISWEGVSVEKINQKELRFILKKPYAPFIKALTLGILPKHIWQNASSEELPFSEWNIAPIGSGPYKIKKVDRNSAGLPSSILLESWNKYPNNKPFIKYITFKFFSNQNDLFKSFEAGEIDSIAHLDEETATYIEKKSEILSSSLPRVFAVFFNQNSAPIFLNKEVRKALDLSAPKEIIVGEVLGGFGKVSTGPTVSDTIKERENRDNFVEEAKKILSESGWKMDEESGVLKKKIKSETLNLAFSISTSDAPELKETAEILKSAWESIGAKVEIKIYNQSDLNQDIIRSRKYDMLLFGEVVDKDGDLYPFWHSSERNDPGLNISLYANVKTDKLLEELRNETDLAKRNEIRNKLSLEIQNDLPAVFLFVPDMLYKPASKIKNISLGDTSSQSDRFASIYEWFIETDRVWRIFAN
ncbi:MAG: peptide ABC transporter substrate-binding protein [Patescibacteria group bacterium]